MSGEYLGRCDRRADTCRNRGELAALEQIRHRVTHRRRGEHKETGKTLEIDLPVPNITVYRQKENREHVIVLCEVDMERYMLRWLSITLSVESEEKYTIKRVTSSQFTNTCLFMVTVSSPASFTCETKVYYKGKVKNLRSHTYTYEWSVLDHHEEGVSLFYICFSSFIAVGLVIMTAAVIVTTIRSKAKGVFQQLLTVRSKSKNENNENAYTMC
ncbi:hypothetical protein DPX16_3402 [Anabarilius grahami]|uniref:Uncharacterized protein n=1 Tax=Anabarilius grahami TaxID=495550 RepID=A0A3N0XLQ3_ANAGA|nr:hypothetical protein DPX16_3402 [Anabarilius grahami]